MFAIDSNTTRLFKIKLKQLFLCRFVSSVPRVVDLTNFQSFMVYFVMVYEKSYIRCEKTRMEFPRAPWMPVWWFGLQLRMLVVVHYHNKSCGGGEYNNVLTGLPERLEVCIIA